MALTSKEQSLVDSCLQSAQTASELETCIKSNLSTTVHPPNPDAADPNNTSDVVNYLDNLTGLSSAKQSIVDAFLANYGL